LFSIDEYGVSDRVKSKAEIGHRPNSAR
jgi:hypothetical protein